MATSSRFSSSSLKDEIKGVIKSEFEKSVKSLCSEEELKKVSSLSESYSEYVSRIVNEKVENPMRDKKLEILYNHEKHFLDILKEYKEEIKFAASLRSRLN